MEGKTVSTTPHDLPRQWLEYFGAAFVQELDLGTLGAIKKWIDEGRAPPLHTSFLDDPPTPGRPISAINGGRSRHSTNDCDQSAAN